MTLQVLHRLEFDAEYLMSGVIAEAASARQEGPQIFLKGSVHAVVQLVAHNRLPWDWAHVSSTVCNSSLPLGCLFPPPAPLATPTKLPAKGPSTCE